MNYSDNRESLYIALCFFIFGIVCVGIYTVLAVLLNTLKKTVYLPSVISEDARKKNFRLLKLSVKSRLVANDGDLALGEVFNFLFIVAFGIFMTLLNYVLLDGEFRIYTVSAFLVGIFVSKRAFSKYIRGLFGVLLVSAYTFVLIFFRPVFMVLTYLGRKQNKKKDNGY